MRRRLYSVAILLPMRGWAGASGFGAHTTFFAIVLVPIGVAGARS
jgi:cytochrome b561